MKTIETNPTQKVPSEFNAALHAKCPRCRKGDVFANSMYGFSQQKMNTNCGHCGLRYEREPGYFYVAMFVSYAMTTFQMIVIGVLTYLVTREDNSPWIYVTTIFIGILLLSPFNFRYSRVILLYWLTPGLNFSPERSEQPKNENSGIASS